MKLFKHLTSLIALFVVTLPFMSCQNSKKSETPDSCYIQLFDGDNFEDSDIVIKGPGEFGDLNDLRNSDGEDWTDEADSFIVGDKTTVEVWNQKDFEGDSHTYDPGKYSSVDDVYSLKISCEDEGK